VPWPFLRRRHRAPTAAARGISALPKISPTPLLLCAARDLQDLSKSLSRFEHAERIISKPNMDGCSSMLFIPAVDASSIVTETGEAPSSGSPCFLASSVRAKNASRRGLAAANPEKVRAMLLGVDYRLASI
jgi:hypothetical protein